MKQTYLRGDSIIDYGFDAVGGFYAIDHLTQTASYAYASSPHAVDAKRCPGLVIRRMFDSWELSGVPDNIRIRHYHAVLRTADGV